MTNKQKDKIIYTDEELRILNEFQDELIIWMFNRPNDSFPILYTLKRAFELGVLHRK
jgi:hypothetical protein